MFIYVEQKMILEIYRQNIFMNVSLNLIKNKWQNIKNYGMNMKQQN